MTSPLQKKNFDAKNTNIAHTDEKEKKKKRKKKRDKKRKKHEKKQNQHKASSYQRRFILMNDTTQDIPNESTAVSNKVPETNKDNSKLSLSEKSDELIQSDSINNNKAAPKSKSEKKKKRKRKRQQQEEVEEEKKRKIQVSNNPIQNPPVQSSPKSPPNSIQKPLHCFPTDQTDHCETPLQAYLDICPLLDYLASTLSKTRSNLIIYDPYYCNGGIVTKLNSLGFKHVINQNVDFYKSVEKNQVPEYDVLVTNPPYSGVHVEKLLQFITTGSTVVEDAKEAPKKKKQRTISKDPNKLKPYVLLLPHYVYTKPYYQNIYHPSSATTAPYKPPTTAKPLPFFLIPPHRYSYIPPSWVSSSKGSTAIQKGKDKTAPFPSFWYCSSNNNQQQQEEEDKLEKWLVRTYNPSGIFNNTKKKGKKKKRVPMMQYANSTQHIPYEYQGELDVQKKKRPNPRTRKRMMAMRRQKQNMNE